MKSNKKENVSNTIRLMMNPVRLRIIQYLIIHESGTASMMKEELRDIPPASLYRHIKILYDGNCIIVTEEKKIRGTVEKTYALNPSPMGEFTKESMEQMIQSMLLSLMASFGHYFKEKNADPIKDKLALSTSLFLLTDEEFDEMLNKMGEQLMPYIKNMPKEGRKPRRITIISSPNEKE